METHFPTSTRLKDPRGSTAPPYLHQLERDPRRHRLGTDREPGWPLLLVIVVLLAMLLVFHYVVRGSVQQSELRHKAVAVHAHAISRCKNLKGREVSDNCLKHANVEAQRVALLQYRTSPQGRVPSHDPD